MEEDFDIRQEQAAKGEKDFENALRPLRFGDFSGQQKVVENLEVFVEAAKYRGEPLDHTLLHGPPGLGKTTLSNIIANELGVGFKITSGPVLDKPGDLAGILTSLEPRDVLFIDEIHRLSPVVEEYLYSAMEDFAIDILIDQGPNARASRSRIFRWPTKSANCSGRSLLSKAAFRLFSSSLGRSFFILNKEKGQAAGLSLLFLNGWSVSLLGRRRTVVAVTLALEVFDDLAHVRELLGILLGNRRAKFFLKSHDELDGVERVRAQIVDERRLQIDLLRIDAELVNDNLFHAIFKLTCHLFSPYGWNNS